MESQVVHSRVLGQPDEHDPNTVGLHSVVEGEDHGEHHHEKKSVLKKVKAKAKKLKDTITKHGHGHDHDQDDHHEGRVPGDHDLDEEDEEDEDEEMVEDPELHGAPMYDSAAMRAAAPGLIEDRNPPSHRSQAHAAGEEKRDQQRAGSGGRMPVEEGPRAPANTPQSTAPLGTATRTADPSRTFVHDTSDQSKVNLSAGLEEDPDAPKDREELYRPPNYETKVTDTTGSGGHEAKIAPLGQSFGGMHIHDQSERKPSKSSATLLGSHDQFSPEPMTKETETLLGSRGHGAEGGTATRTEGGPKDEKPSSLTGYTGKISSAATAATSVVAEKAAAAKNILTSKLGYGTSPEGDAKDKSTEQPSSQGGYTEKLSAATHAISDKATLATNVVASKIGYGVKEDQTAHKSSGVTEEMGDKPSEQSSYTGKIAAAAGSAKDVVASKLGYGKKDDAAHHETEQQVGEGSTTTSATGQGKNAVGQDKGVSVRDYLAEKLKPGEEDRALSEVISGALDKRKKETEKPVVVTESEELRRHLGEGSQSEGQLSSPGRAVVGKLKEAVGSWFGKSADPHAPQQSHGSEAVASGADTTREKQVCGERKVQESMS